MGELKRNCPKCGREVFYTNKYNLKYADVNNFKCRFCRILGIKHAKPVNPDDLKRNCPKCNREIIYSRKDGAVRANKENRLCIFCVSVGREIPQEVRNKISKSNIGKKRSEETKYKIRLATIKDLKEKRIKFGYNCMGNFNPVACEYINKINKEKGWNLQHALNGGEVELYGYFVDGYDKEKNIIFEYDETDHEKLSRKKKDLIRQDRIIYNYRPNIFIRYSEKDNRLYDALTGKDISI
jgi:endogenous inhibitor of DNA gyrase (YacG/DUF329 family)